MDLKVEGTPVYLDVEGLPDREFYYLIGLRIGTGERAVQHSLWADTIADQGRIWGQFLDVLRAVENPLMRLKWSTHLSPLPSQESRSPLAPR